jgi:hypothetical protein
MAQECAQQHKGGFDAYASFGVAANGLNDCAVKAPDRCTAPDLCRRPWIGYKERRSLDPILCIHWAHGTNGEALSLEDFPNLIQTSADGVAESEDAVLGKGLAGVYGDPLNPRLDMLVQSFAFRGDKLAALQQRREEWQMPVLDVPPYVLEIDFVRLYKQQRLYDRQFHDRYTVSTFTQSCQFPLRD